MMMRDTFIVISTSILLVFCHDRKLSTQLNPGCASCGDEVTLVYTRGDGADSLHQLWDTTRGAPTLVLAASNLDNNLTVVWKGGVPVDFVWRYEPIYSFVVVFHEVWEFWDVNNTGIWSPGLPTRKLAASSLVWHRRELLHDEQVATLRLDAALPNTTDGTMHIDVSWLAFSEYSDVLPHLQRTANSSLLHVSLSSAAGGGGCPRLALCLLLASSDPSDTAWTSRVDRTLDDEYTPGIFKVVRLLSPGAAMLQYRPVAYTSRVRDVAGSTLAQLGFLARATRPAPGTAGVWFAREDPFRVLLQRALVSFGSPGDGCYARTNFTSWSASMSYGALPQETWSARVWFWLVAGAGTPFLLLIGYLAWHYCRRGSFHRLL